MLKGRRPRTPLYSEAGILIPHPSCLVNESGEVLGVGVSFGFLIEALASKVMRTPVKTLHRHLILKRKKDVAE